MILLFHFNQFQVQLNFSIKVETHERLKMCVRLILNSKKEYETLIIYDTFINMNSFSIQDCNDKQQH